MRSAMLAAALALASGCGTTQVITNEPRARIFVDGEMVGRGRGEVSQRGVPHTAEVVVKAPDGRSARARMKRSFTGWTFVIGLFTYATGFIWAWEYPDLVDVPLEDRAVRGWDASPADDPWLAAPAGWQPSPSPVPSPEPVPTPTPTPTPTPPPPP